MTEYLTGEQLLDRLRDLRCLECGRQIPSDEKSISIARGQCGLRYTIECPNCGATESFEAVAEGN